MNKHKQELLKVLYITLQSTESAMKIFQDSIVFCRNQIEKYELLLSVDKSNKKIEEECSQGVIYCLKQKKYSDSQESATSLYPYFLVYVKDNGEIHLTNTNPKKILDIYKSLCQTKSEPIERLVKEFNQETKNGT